MKILFLDRDGVINVDHGFVAKKENLQFMEGIFAFCHRFVDEGYQIVIVTNQTGIGYGKYQLEDFQEINQMVNEEFNKNGLTIMDVFYCPHHPDAHCDCHKPKPGMILKALEKYQVNPHDCLLVGDKMSDILAGKNAGIPNLYFLKGKFNSDAEPFIYRSVADFSEIKSNLHYFGTDGIRGKVGEKLTYDLAYRLGQSLAILGKKLLIGQDTRLSSKDIAAMIKKGAIEKGVDVFDLGLISTPGLIYSSLKHECLGVMITASHNPYMDNGIKVVDKGIKIAYNNQLAIEDYIDGLITIDQSEDGQEEKYLFEEDYLTFLASLSFPINNKVVIDAANGATSFLISKVFNQVRNLVITANEPNGYNINNGVGSTHINHLLEIIENDQVGLALDGDGDRLIMCSDKVVYDGDMLCYIIAHYFREKGLFNNRIVLTKMSNLGVINALTSEGFMVFLSDVGDQNVLKLMKENDCCLGAENSGHIITPYLDTGDGMLTGLLILRILEEKGATLAELTKNIVLFYDKMVNVKVQNKNIMDSKLLKNRVMEIGEALGKNGKIILRKSGTENVIRISVMAKDEEVLNIYLNELVGIVNKLNGSDLK